MKKGVAIQPLLWYNIKEVKESKRGDNMKQECWMCDVCGRTVERSELMQVDLPSWGLFFVPMGEGVERQHKVTKYSFDLCKDCAKEMANILYDDFGIGEKE